MYRLIAALNMPRSVSAAIAFARSVVNAMTGNPALPSPSPPLAELAAHIAALEAAEARVLTRARGTAEARNTALGVVRSDLEYLRAYVQKIVDASPEGGAAIIESAGMSLKAPGLHTKAPLVAVPGPAAGSIRLVAKSAGDRAFYEWQHSTDGETWETAPTTIQSTTTFLGLVPRIYGIEG